MMAVGNLLELGHLLDKRFYDGTLPKESLEEHNVARLNYHLLQKIFVQKYSVKIDGQLVSPIAIFRRSFVTFAASLVVYKWWGYDEGTDGVTCTPQLFDDSVVSMIKGSYPESFWDYKEQSRRPLYMHWMKSSLYIRARLPEDRAGEISELDGDQDDNDDDDDDDDNSQGDDEQEEHTGVQGKADTQPAASSSTNVSSRRKGAGEIHPSSVVLHTYGIFR